MNSNDTPEISQYTRTLIAVKGHQLIGHYGFTRCDRDDLMQEFTIAVLEATGAWDETRGSRNTFDNRIVNRKIATLIRHRKRECRDYRRNGASLEEVSRDEDGTPISLGEMLTDDADRRWNDAASVSDRIDLSVDLRRAVSVLKPELQRLCALLARGSAADAARALDVSRPTVFKWIRMIRDRFTELGLDEYVEYRADGSTGDGVCNQ
ncbi:MAG: hypothetical protein KAS72_12990 [Phycisphaerales bacterium]|nr:hypothetical protein [Phycisphaerales bacterium]